MSFLLWWWYEGRPSARIKRETERLAARFAGEKMYRKQIRELEKLGPPPKYDLGASFEKLKNSMKDDEREHIRTSKD